MKGLGVHVVSYATWNELQAELRALRAERDGMLAERKDTLDLSRRRLDESQAEIARLTEALTSLGWVGDRSSPASSRDATGAASGRAPAHPEVSDANR